MRAPLQLVCAASLCPDTALQLTLRSRALPQPQGSGRDGLPAANKPLPFREGVLFCTCKCHSVSRSLRT